MVALKMGANDAGDNGQIERKPKLSLTLLYHHLTMSVTDYNRIEQSEHYIETYLLFRAEED